MPYDFPLQGRDICLSDISGGCVRSVVPKQLYVNFIWSQTHTFVVYTTVSVLETFIIFCKGDQQPPDSSSLSPLGNSFCYCLNITTAEFHCHVCGSTCSGRHKYLSIQLSTSHVTAVASVLTMSSNKCVYLYQSLYKTHSSASLFMEKCTHFAGFPSHLSLTITLVKQIWQTSV